MYFETYRRRSASESLKSNLYYSSMILFIVVDVVLLFLESFMLIFDLKKENVVFLSLWLIFLVV